MLRQHFSRPSLRHWPRLSSLMLFLTLILTLAPTQLALAAAVWKIQTLDSTGEVGVYTALALDSNGNPVISYFDNTNRDLKVVYCGNAICNTGNTVVTVDSAGSTGTDPALVLDSSGKPVISYYSQYGLRLLHCGDTTCTSGNTIRTVDLAGAEAAQTGLALDSNGKPIISYYDGFPNYDLKVVHCGDSTCSSGNSIVTVDNADQVGGYSSLKLDNSGNPVISYFGSLALRLVHCGNANCSSNNSIVTVDNSGYVGWYTSLALDSTGRPVISYYDVNNQDLKLAYCGNANCSGGNTIQTLDNTGNVGGYTSLALESAGKPIISYTDFTGRTLKLMRCGNANCSSSNTIEVVDEAGWYTSLKLDSGDNPVISYYAIASKDLKVARLVNDTVGPTATPSQLPAANANGWNKTDVTVNWNWTDNAGGSGLDTAHCPASSTSSGEGTLTLTATCYDRAGNVGTASYTVKVDKTAPTANPSQSPSDNGNGWTGSDVTVNWNWSDKTGGSGRDLTRCTTISTSSGEGVQTLAATCQDKAGNIGTASYTVKIDKTAPVANPTLSPAPNAAGWNNTNVTVNWNWADGASGVDPANCEASTTSNLGVGTQTLTAYCADAVGNLTQASYTVKVDRAAPFIRANISPSANGFGWNNSAVTVSFTCQDQGTLSGVATNTVGGNQTFSSEGANFTATNTGGCTDFAGNVATPVTAGPIKLDLTKPTISAAATTQPNANGWYNSDVTVHFTCADNLSGAFACPADQTLSSEGTAVSSTAQTVQDRALNSSAASNIVTVKIDKTAPSVLLTGVTNGATYNFGSVPTTACSTTDALSGVATQATLNLTGGNPDGSGNFTATCSGATDLAGNSAAAVSVSYTVNPPLLPEIAVTGNGQPIVSGSTTPSSSNGTSFADSVVGSAVTQTFTIANSGPGVLNLSGAPRVSLSGANAADFSVVTLPAATVAAGSSTPFQIRFTPSAVGVRTAMVTIVNNDSDENPYTFVIQGGGLQSLQPTSQLTQLPGYTQSCTAASAPYVKRCTLSFTLKNTSGGPLQIRYEQLTKLSTHVYVLNGTPNPGQVGTVVSDVRSLAANATFPPTFQLGLTSNTAYSLFFKVYGYPGATVAAGADEAQAVELGEFEVTLNPDETPTTTTLFLPLINR